ncbi:NUDIX domain-containing protein [Fodinibius sp. SL11]|uniref:NUDIX domain-containing protein n=1 Tax=Fodinibius sp. SL11 TaxID=3425690 RepID=UPI003F880BA8
MSLDQGFINKLRVRICGLLIQNDEVLLAQIHSPITDKLVWMPPGGGLTFGEPMKDCLKREFKEETNLSVEVHELIHVNELLRKPYHAVECFFEVKKTGGDEKLGKDPELSWDRQLLHDLEWIPLNKLKEIEFAPSGLEEKLQHWDQRFKYPVF